METTTSTSPARVVPLLCNYVPTAPVRAAGSPFLAPDSVLDDRLEVSGEFFQQLVRHKPKTVAQLVDNAKLHRCVAAG